MIKEITFNPYSRSAINMHSHYWAFVNNSVNVYSYTVNMKYCLPFLKICTAYILESVKFYFYFQDAIKQVNLSKMVKDVYKKSNKKWAAVPLLIDEK